MRVCSVMSSAMPRSGNSVRAASAPARESVAICDLIDAGSSVAVRMLSRAPATDSSES